MGFYQCKGLAIFISSAIAAVGQIALYANPSIAQITPDATLPNNSVVDSVNKTLNITEGTQAGGNLFHSFKEFSVPTGWEAVFKNGADIQNILTRVTGKSISEIDGLIKANGSANLFLMNPNGIIFGENASLDINGSFVGSTANGIGIDNQDFFNLLNSQPNSQLLTIKPDALFFNQIQGGKIETNSSELTVPEGESLLLVGGDIIINGGSLRADGGRIDLAGLAENGVLGLNINNNELSLSVPDNVTRADISVVNSASIDVAAGGGGSIGVNARNLEVTQRSRLSAGIGRDLGSAESVAGDITINATDKVIFDGQGSDIGTGAASEVGPEAEGNAGGVEITTDSLQILNGAYLSATTFGIGDAGSVKINATDVIFDGQGSDRFTGAFSGVGPEAEGNAGGVEITTDSLQILNGAYLSASTFGIGDAGSVKINATDKVIFDGQGSDIFTGAVSQVEFLAEGKAGGVEITTDSLEVLNGAQLNASTFGIGDAGSVKIIATDVIFDGQGSDQSTGAFSSVETGGEGDAGDLTILTGNLVVKDGAFLSASTFGIGDGGNLNVTVSESIEVIGNEENGGGLFTQAASGSEGNGGDINVNTGSLSVTNNAQISAQTRSNTTAGTVRIDAYELVEVNGLGSSLSSRTGDRGDAGTLIIDTPELRITDNAQVGVNNFIETDFKIETFKDKSGRDIITVVPIFEPSDGSGNAGTLDINVINVVLEDGGGIVAKSAGGDGGNIQLTIDNLIQLRRGSSISSEAGLQETGGNGGNIQINAKFIVAPRNQNSDIIANAFDGLGGNINITTEGLFGLEARSSTPINNTNDIDASSEFGLNGNVEITTPDIDPTDGLIELPVNLVDASNQISKACTPGGSQFQNEFISTGKGGLPMNPTQPLQETSTLSTWVKLKPQSQNSASTTIKLPSKKVANHNKVAENNQIVEATGWIVDKDGNIEFVAQANQINPHTKQTPACDVSK